ncbi:hypothetical protein B0H16DRAFT_1738377 [Mycena metata]|uniref:DUF5648 domain-containing protein n=1 Tax=Mycena metata TaxID=1033252 RepID=A0AAD7ML40_9AGAR|nr:hypothetical protein B0H16DRAFT_1738377 [Mycena metata]
MNLKHTLALLLSITVGLTSARNVTGIDTPEAAQTTQGRSAATCGDPADALPLYRFLTGTGAEYIYFADLPIVQTQAAAKGWTFQGVAALVFTTQEVSTVPLYGLLHTGDESLYVADTTELANALDGGYVLSGEPLVYIYPTQICGSVPFYYLTNAAKNSNFYTAVESERLDFINNQGYTDVNVAGYVLPLGCSQCS